MNTLTLQQIEEELLDIADSWDKRERILRLARRIAVQLVTEAEKAA